MVMALTEEEKAKIQEEEAYRAEARNKLNQQTPNPSTTPPKKKGIGCLGIIGILFVFGIVMAGIVQIANPAQRSSDTAPEIGTENLTKSTATNINISRQTIVSALKDYSFRKEAELKTGQENYVARNNVAEIQLLGSTDNLNSASFTVYLTKGTAGERVVAMSAMTLFGSSVDIACGKWFTNQVVSMNSDKTKIYTKSEFACGRKLSFYYYPGDTFTFGIEPQ
jgi:hypothetical protein